MMQNMNIRIKLLSDERGQNRMKMQNIHSLNRRLKQKRDQINIFSKCKFYFLFFDLKKHVNLKKKSNK